ncbi:MAG: hypothetical protein D6784_13650 [Chloroflexi bacterium]|nr:MAG: hypothetical protein D6784_13650 [Chloroflexota bacterium]
MGAAFLPWVGERAVALQLTGPGLAEFVKFLPAVRLGEVHIQRLYFLLPLFTAMLTLPLAAVNRTVSLPGGLRWLFRLAAVPLALASLSPVWTPAILVSAEFRLQTILALTSMGLVVVGPVFKRLPWPWLAVGLAVAGTASIILPVRAFGLVQAGIAEAYNHPVVLGWGWTVTVLGLGAAVVGSLWLAAIRKNPAE